MFICYFSSLVFFCFFVVFAFYKSMIRIFVCLSLTPYNDFVLTVKYLIYRLCAENIELYSLSQNCSIESGAFLGRGKMAHAGCFQYFW